MGFNNLEIPFTYIYPALILKNGLINSSPIGRAIGLNRTGLTDHIFFKIG
jgi:hypothetical protein